MHIDPIHALFSTTPTSSLFVINSQHQPLIKTFLPRIHYLPQCSYWHIRNLIQQLLITTSKIYHLLRLIMKGERPTCSAFESPFLSYLPPCKSPSLHSMLHPPQPSIVRCQSALQNTQTNKTSYPSSQVFLKQLLLYLS